MILILHSEWQNHFSLMYLCFKFNFAETSSWQIFICYYNYRNKVYQKKKIHNREVSAKLIKKRYVIGKLFCCSL